MLNTGIKRSSLITGERLAYLIAIVFIIALSLFDIGRYTIPTIYNDEFGYWSNAQLLFNDNWLALSKETPYYGFGYSLLLIPIVAIFDDPFISYHVGIIVNTILVIGEYFCAVYILKTHYKIEKFSPITHMMAFVSVVSCVTLFNVRITWSETLVAFLYWVIAALFVKLEKEFSCAAFVVMYVLMILSYITHQRCLGIILTMAFCGLLLVLKKKKYPYILLILAFSAGAIIIQNMTKQYQNAIIGFQRTTNLNDMDGSMVSSSFQALLANFKYFILSVAGKTYMATFSSLGIIWVGFIAYIGRLISLIKKKEKHENFIFETFIVLSFLLLLALTSFRSIDASRKDYIVYSRYMDFTCGPIFLLSLYQLVNDFKNKQKIFYFSLALTAVLSCFVYYRYTEAEASFNVTCSPFVGGVFYWTGYSQFRAIFLTFLISFVIIEISALMLKLKNGKYIAVILCSILMVINVFLAFQSNDSHHDTDQKYIADLTPMKEELLAKDYNIYYIKNMDSDHYSVRPKFLQYLIYDKPIYVVNNANEINEHGDKYYILINKGNKNDISGSWDYIRETSHLALYVAK